MIKPVNNQVLIEVVDEYSGLSHSGGEQQRGVVRAISVSFLHLTASTGFRLAESSAELKSVDQQLEQWVGKTVRYALYADADSSRFTEDGKDYVLIPWYRILGVEQ